MGRLANTNKDIFSVCPLSVWDDGKGGTSRTRHFESTHSRKNGQTHFARHRLG